MQGLVRLAVTMRFYGIPFPASSFRANARNPPCTPVKRSQRYGVKQKIPSDFYVTACMQYTAAMWRSLDCARDDDTKRRSSHISFHPAQQKAAPAGQIYPPPSARPFFKGLLNWHAKRIPSHQPQTKKPRPSAEPFHRQYCPRTSMT